MKNAVAICGYGYVGKAYARFFQNYYDVLVYDPTQTGIEQGVKARYATQEEINEQAILAVVCVPTLEREDGSCDISIVEESIGWLDVPNILIKSAVEPLTTERLVAETGKSICVSPEYIGEGRYFIPYWKYPHPTDVKMHDFLIIGGTNEAMTPVVDIILRVSGVSLRVYKMRAVEAEVVKYMENSWGATKVTFANEFYEICQAFGADYHTVREGFVADPRVERMHTVVFPHSRGFGGKCFPKDVAAIVSASKAVGYTPKLLQQVLDSNKDFRAKNEV